MRPLHQSEDFQDINILSYRMVVAKTTMTGNIQMENDSPPRWFLNAGGVNRDIRLPSIERGMEYTIINSGVANTITVKDFLGNTICVLNPGELAMTFASAEEWLFIAGSNEIGGGGGGGISDAYTAVTDGTTTSVSVGQDTFKLRTGSLLSVVVANDDVTHGDNALFTHASYPAVSILANATSGAAVPTTLAAGADEQVLRRSGGALAFGQVNLASANAVTGNLAIANGGTGANTAVAAFNALSPLTTKGDVLSNDGTNDIRLAVGSNSQVLSANNAQTSGLEWVAANAHAHSTSDITGLQEFVEDTVGAYFGDSSSVDVTYNDAGNALQAAVLPGGVNHNLLLNYVANEHVNHTSVTLTAGIGLAGGGDISASRTFDLDLNDLTDIGEALANNDKFGVFNASGAATRSVNYWDVPTVAVIASSSGTDTYTGTSQFQQLAYRTNRLYLWPCPNTNTGASTLNLDGLGAVSIVKVAAVAMVAGDLLAGNYYWLLYNGTNFLVVGSNAVI